jgi:predicted NBD/HSP70 family sugar kinase
MIFGRLFSDEDCAGRSSVPFVRGVCLRRDRVGPVRQLASLAWLAPRLADRIVTRALTSRIYYLARVRARERTQPKRPVASVLVVDVGGSHVKVRASGEPEKRRADSGPAMTAAKMVAAVRELAAGWDWDRVSVGVPSPVHGGRVVAEPVNLGEGWVGFDYEAAFGRPTKVVNDAAMQALGSYEGGTMLFLGLGTGLGSALVSDGLVQPMELGHLPYRKATFEDYTGEAALERRGKKRWRRDVADAIETLRAALEPDYVVLGGGNADKLKELSENVRLGDNENAFLGGFRLWDPDAPARIVGLG